MESPETCLQLLPGELPAGDTEAGGRGSHAGAHGAAPSNECQPRKPSSARARQSTCAAAQRGLAAGPPADSPAPLRRPRTAHGSPLTPHGPASACAVSAAETRLTGHGRSLPALLPLRATRRLQPDGTAETREPGPLSRCSGCHPAGSLRAPPSRLHARRLPCRGRG